MRPYLDIEQHGVFATRIPGRPNPIGLSIVKLDRIEKTTLYIRNLDVVNGTPILDIKPYIPSLSRQHGVQVGWLTEIDKESEL